MNKNLKWRILLIFGVMALALYFTFPLEKRINLGLDLKGGMHLLLEVDTSKLTDKTKDDAVLRAIEILRNRIDSLGVGETVIQREGENQILVQLPGITDRDAAKNMIGHVALLEFKLVNSNPALLRDALAGNVPEGYSLKKGKDENEQMLVSNETALKGEYVSDAHVNFDQFNQPNISLVLNGEGSKLFGELTTKHVGERLAIVVDDIVLSAPNIREPITSGTAEITGRFNFDEASQLSLQLRSGALPAPIHVAEERTIGPLLGKDSINAGIKASVLGTAAIFVFMGVYYLLPGMIANVALFFHLLIIMGSLGFLRVMMPGSPTTLTLPGIAGIILTLGMAVDANVLINERIREEIAAGRPLASAVRAGFDRAYSAIFDSNITSLIAAFMLFQFGSGPVKGFAVTLSIGLLSSLFCAVTVSHTIFDVMLHFRLFKSLPMLHLFGETKINFISKRYFFYTLSIVLTIACIVSIIHKKKDAYGIDFAGGQIQEYKFTRPVIAEDLRRHLKEANVENAVIQQFDKTPEIIMIRSSEDTVDKVSAVLKEKMSDNPFEILRIEKVGPVVGHNLRQRAAMAMIFALGGILVYIGFRFKHFDFAAAGVIALLHDVFLGAGVIVMMGRQIDLLVITALLTIAGYSINDTIVTYDRVRENLAKSRKANLADIINLSINQTLGRTVLTTSVTMLVVIALFLFGGEVLNTFSLCLLIGFTTGAYSTIFIATPLVLAWEKKHL